MRDGLLAGLVMVGDLHEALAGGVLGERLQHQGRTRHIVKQRVQAIMEQRQPMLHARMAAPLRHRLVEHVVAVRRAEGGDIAGAEFSDGFGRELEFSHRHEIEPAHVHDGALGLGIEAADRLQRIAEEVEPHRQVHARREKIENAAAHRVIARLAHGGGAHEAVQLQPSTMPPMRQDLAGRGRQRLLGEEIAGRHPLKRGIDGGEQDRRPLAAGDTGEPRQRGHPLGDDPGMGRDAVIGLAVPGRELHDLHIGSKKGNARAPAPPDAGRRGRSPARWSRGHPGGRQRPAPGPQ